MESLLVSGNPSFAEGDPERGKPTESGSGGKRYTPQDYEFDLQRPNGVRYVNAPGSGSEAKKSYLATFLAMCLGGCVVGIVLVAGGFVQAPSSGTNGEVTDSPTPVITLRPTVEGGTAYPTGSPTESTTATPSPTSPTTTTPSPTSPTTTPGEFEKGDDGFTNRGVCEKFDVNPTVTAPYAGGRVYPVMGGAVDTDLETFIIEATKVAQEKVEGAVSYGDEAGIIAGSLHAGGTTCPDYFATWARDQALAFAMITDVYETATTQADRERTENALIQYVDHSHQLAVLNPGFDRGEPKFLMTGKVTPEQWCRPQRDGPASRSHVLMRFAKLYIQYHGDAAGKQWVREHLFPTGDAYKSNPSIPAPIKRDLDYLVNNYSQDGACEIWEEVRGHHFYTRLIQRRALKNGAEFAQMMGDTGSASTWSTTADAIGTILNNDYWDSTENNIYTGFENNVKYRRDDVQTTLAVNHADDAADPFFHHGDDRILANIWFTINKAEQFERYTINTIGWKDEPDLGVAIGRYTMNYPGADLGDYWGGEQSNDGCAQNEHLALEVCPQSHRRNDNFCAGQPWFLATNGIAEALYRIAKVYKDRGTIEVLSMHVEFWKFYGCGHISQGTYSAGSSEYNQLLTSLIHAADSFLKRVRYHTNEEYRMDEQYNGATGIQSSAGDLTWSYASFYTAVRHRNLLRPRATIESFTPANGVEVEVVVTNLPGSTSTVSIGATGGICKTATLRRSSRGLAEFSAYVTLPKNSNIELNSYIGSSCSGSTGAKSATIATKSMSPLQPIYVRHAVGSCNLIIP